jgi:cytochrome P450
MSPLSGDEQLECARNVAAFEQYIRQAMADRRAAPGQPGLMSEILASIDRGDYRMTDNELVLSFTQEMILGGHETTALALVSSLYHLLSDRDRLWQPLLDDPSQVANMVEEMLRVEPPAFAMRRRSIVDFELDGVTIPAGSAVLWVAMGGNYDEEHFPHATDIDLKRANARTHLAFGKGPHLCLGAPLARLEMKVAYEVLTERLPGLRLAPGQGPLTYFPSITMRPSKELQVEWN